MTWERVLGVLKERGMTNCIRIKEEVDKEVLRTLGPHTLADVGCKLGCFLEKQPHYSHYFLL